MIAMHRTNARRLQNDTPATRLRGPGNREPTVAGSLATTLAAMASHRLMTSRSNRCNLLLSDRLCGCALPKSRSVEMGGTDDGAANYPGARRQALPRQRE